MLLSIITVAFRNLEGIVKTHASLAHLAQADDISFEWIVVDGGSNDGTREYWKISMVSITYALSASQITVSTTP
ncbi:glycosyl transferase family protein [Escherichia coli]|uniref:Glycosyl transferase family protein n=1 Tax=Escherichia coli TaxID=562 RepID=A0A377BP63_ECOLX|nr:glycosyl transferase family protein [Escherichia coli]